MTNRVVALEETVIRQIAAGEVVERPASVVKELVENALDAGSRHVSLETRGGGRELIRVADDGCGMTAEDALLALERHTTSKIRRTEDLESLSTFGFRGEALPSIASIAKLEVISHSADEPYGVSLSLAGGKLVAKKECGRAYGTTLEVRDLFFNTPARLKFMKSEATERAKILRTFEEIALAHPEVAFDYKSGAGRSLELPPRKNALDRITDLWGKDFSRETLFPLSFEHPSLKIEGWVSNPQSHLAAKNNQAFYVNRRPIVSRLLIHALYEAFRDCLPVGRHPAAVIFLTLDPALVDVNVHPAKREVRFRNESQIYEALVREIRLKRSQISSSPKLFEAPAPALPDRTFEPKIPYRSRFEPRPHSATPPAALQIERPQSPAQPLLETAAAARAPRVLAQFQALYILAEREGNLVIVDQHAASERVHYERLKKAFLSSGPAASQPLLIPVVWNVSFAQAELLRNHLTAFRKLGFQIEPFGEKTFRVGEAPAAIPEAELKGALDAILATLEDRGQADLGADEKILRTAACRAAVKANDPLSSKELAQILEELDLCENPRTCPHGRPTTLTLTRPELDKKFGRNY